MVMPTAGPVIVTVVMGMAVTMGMPMVITARFAVRMIVPVVVGMPMVMVRYDEDDEEEELKPCFVRKIT